MVQLKSFRFIEPDSQLASRSASLKGTPADPQWRTSQTNLNNSEEFQEAKINFKAEDDNEVLNDKLETEKIPNETHKKSVTRTSTNDSLLSMQPGNQASKFPGGSLKAKSGDSISAVMSSNFNLQMASDNCFEIRWRYLHLYSRTSKVPRMIAENCLYKQLFATKKPQDEVPTSAMVSKSPIPPGNNDLLDEFSSSEYRQILNNVSGSVYSGQLTGILGPSGVGKSTLLNTLTGRNQLDGCGKVKLIGCAEKRISVVFVPQIDVLPGRLTTIEDLRFTSHLKNPKFTVGMHERNIQRVVKLLHMEKFLHTRINKLSGGQERRLSIARELLSSPNIMILDEPTSGLDANTCKKIIKALRYLVEQSENILGRPMSIIVTIHQPQREVYDLFHRVNVMAVGGRVIYEGTPGDLMPTFLENCGLAKLKPKEEFNDNPAIVAIEVASGEYGATVIDELATHHAAQCEDFVTSDMATPTLSKKNRAYSNPFLTPTLGRKKPKNSENLDIPQWDAISAVTNVSYSSSYDPDLPEPIAPGVKVDKRLRRSVVLKGDFTSQTWTLIRRCWLLNIRDFFLISVRLFGFVAIGLGLAAIYNGALDPNDHSCPLYQSEIDDFNNFLMRARIRLANLSSSISQSIGTGTFMFHMVFFILMVSSALGGLMFPLQLRMFLREYKNGWYSPASFITSITLAEMPIDFLGPAITVMVAYPLCNQPASPYHWREIGYIVIVILASIICKSQAHMAGAFLVDSVENSVFISCVLVTVPVLLCDIPVRVLKLPQYLQLASLTSFMKWALDGLYALRYGFGLCPCDEEVIHGFPLKLSKTAIPPSFDGISKAISNLYDVESTGDDDNIIFRFIKIATQTANSPVEKLEELGDCSSYRSLILIEKHISENSVPISIAVLIGYLIVMRFSVYFCVRTVIKLRG